MRFKVKVGIGLEPGRQLCPKDLVLGPIAVPGSQSVCVISGQRVPQLGVNWAEHGLGNWRESGCKGAVTYRAKLALL